MQPRVIGLDISDESHIFAITSLPLNIQDASHAQVAARQQL